VSGSVSSHEAVSIRLVGIDVDGTLVGASGIVDPRIWQAAQKARAADIRLSLCSGRPAFGLALEYAKHLGDGWHSFQNGASIVHLASGRSLSTPLPTDAIALLIAQARSTGHILELYSDNDFVCESSGAWAHAHAKLLGIPYTPRAYESLKGAVVRAQWLVSPSDSPRVIAAVPAGVEVAESTSPIMPDARFIGITRTGISKGSALRTIVADYGMSLGEVMYIGDAGNDLSALQIVGYPVAMANADPAVLRIARHITGHVDHAGVADALELAIADNGALG
jgi:Cof subfamily protein (haloacid dehalogenase superfamily)